MSPNSILRSTFLTLYLKEDNAEASFAFLEQVSIPLGQTHIPEQVLSKGDRVKSGYSEIMIAQFILNCRLFKQSAMYAGHMLFLTLYMSIAMSCNRR